MSGEHQLLIRDQKLVLHHVARASATHHGMTHWLVAMSHTDARGDHVLPLNEPDCCNESRERMILDEAKDLVFDSWNFAPDGLVARMPVMVHVDTTEQHRAVEMAIAQWSCIRLLI